MTAPLRTALALSALCHALFCVWVEVRGEPARPTSPNAADRFSGEGIEVEAVPVERSTASESEAQRAAAAARAAEAAREAEAKATADAAREEASAPSDAKPEAAARAPEGTPDDPPRKLRKIPAKPASEAVPSPLSNTDRLSSLPSPKPAASATATAGTEGSTATGTAAASGSTTSDANPAGAQYGAAGLPPGVRHLPRAFTRALALANRGDARWREVAPGRVGEAHVRLAVNAEGELGELEYTSAEERERLAPVVQKLLSNTLLLLRAGRFSVDPKALTAGVTRMRVMVEVTENGPPSAEGDPVELFGLGSDAPQPGKPGKSGFVLNSGRQVTAWVWLE